ncbi:phage major capsid protein [uncultured Mobiluncus sp.]|uniref:phage major capsid protein n=1 Tax=uncultured Mobiluncus sp. TaxID=293425 RepID=UPI0026284685|nr:phage major capsid protein [uncultured Mobiluncus sp.]
MALGANANTLDKIQSEGVLPKAMATKIMTDAFKGSIAGTLAGTIPMPITGASIAFTTGDPVAGIVGEGELKPVSKAGVTVKSTRPIKAATVMYWSKEARQANPLAYLNMLESQAREAVSRAIDMAVIHGKNALTNTDIAGVEPIAKTANSVTLGTANAAAGGLTADLLAGYELVANKKGKITGWAGDERMRLKLFQAVDTYGRPIYSTTARGGVDLKDPMGDLLGLPLTYGDAVCGHIGAVEDTKVRLIGGDFKNNIQFGYVENITVRKSDQATITDGTTVINLWQQNMEAFIVECQFGWIIRDVNEFVLYKVA